MPYDDGNKTQFGYGSKGANTSPEWGLDMTLQLPDVMTRTGDEGSYLVTPSDGALLPKPVTRLYLGVAGNIKIEKSTGEVLTLTSLPTGFQSFAYTIVRIFATLTTASEIVAVLP